MLCFSQPLQTSLGNEVWKASGNSHQFPFPSFFLISLFIFHEKGSVLWIESITPSYKFNWIRNSFHEQTQIPNIRRSSSLIRLISLFLYIIFPTYQTITLPIVKCVKYLLLLQKQKSILHMNAITSYNCSIQCLRKDMGLWWIDEVRN